MVKKRPPQKPQPNKKKEAPARKKKTVRKPTAANKQVNKTKKSKPIPPKKGVKSKTADLEEYKKKRRLKSKKYASITSVVVLVLVTIGVLVYIVRGAFGVLEDKSVATIAVEYGTIDLPTILNGIIVRDENVYESPATGSVYFNYGDLERVKKGVVICSVQNEEFVQELNTNLQNVSAEIFDMQKKREDISGFSQDVKRTNKQIQENIDNARRRFLSDNMEAIYLLKENVERNIAIRNNMLLSENRGSVQNLVENKNTFQQKLKDGVKNITTNETGILCYSVDGTEKLLSVENLESISPEQTRMTVDYAVIKRKTAVNETDPIFKIIESNTWYIALYAPKELVYDYKEKEQKTIYIENDGAFEPLSMTVYKIIENEKENFILFSTNNNMLDYIDMRGIKIKLTNSGFNGFKIPVAAIVDRTFLKIPVDYVNEEDSTVIRKLMKNDTFQYETISLNIKSTDDDFVYIYQDLNKGIMLGDTLANPINKEKEIVLSSVENVKGVFVLNNGYADFEPIIITEDLPEKDGYVILNAELNKNIRLNDKIIYDTKTLVDGQKLSSVIE